MAEPRRGYGFYRVLERGADPPTSPDFAGSAVPDTSPAVIIIDGLNSTSDTHRISIYTSERLGVKAYAFSYTGVGLAYGKRQTKQDISLSSSLLVDYLPSTDQQQTVPVGISLGAVVAVLGVGEWIRQKKFAYNRFSAAVPMIILIAPALTPHHDLNDAYASDEQGTPEAVRQLCDVGSTDWVNTQHSMSSALALIRWANIPVFVIHWPPDILTPFPWTNGIGNIGPLLVTATRLLPENLSLPPAPSENSPTYAADYQRYQSAGATAHIRFLGHERVVEETRSRLTSRFGLGQ